MTADMRRRWLIRLGKTALVLLALFMLLRWFEYKQTYHPSRKFYTSGEELGRAWEDVNFIASDGVKLNGWFFPANTNSPRAQLVVVICHGNAGNICNSLLLCDPLLTTGVNVFAFDYRGFGTVRAARARRALISTRKQPMRGCGKKVSRQRTSLCMANRLVAGLQVSWSCARPAAG